MYGKLTDDISFRAYEKSLDAAWLTGLLAEGETLNGIVQARHDCAMVMVSKEHGQLQYVQIFFVNPKVVMLGFTYSTANTVEIRGSALIDWVRKMRPNAKYLDVGPRNGTFYTMLKRRSWNGKRLQEILNADGTPSGILRMEL